MKTDRSFKKIVVIFLVFALGLACKNHVGGQESKRFEKLDVAYEQIKLSEQMNRAYINRERLLKAETNILEFVDQRVTLSNRAKIFLAVAHMFSTDITHYPEKTAYYCQMALNLPQSPVDACGLYSDWGRALQTNQPSAETRQTITRLYLKAFNLIATNKIPETLQPSPRFGKYSDHSGAWNEEDMRRIEQERLTQQRERQKLIDEVERQNTLVAWRAIFVEKLADMYGGAENELNELRKLAQSEFGDSQLVADLIRRVKEPKVSVKAATELRKATKN